MSLFTLLFSSWGNFVFLDYCFSFFKDLIGWGFGDWYRRLACENCTQEHFHVAEMMPRVVIYQNCRK